jgi:hypothetical protein
MGLGNAGSNNDLPALIHCRTNQPLANGAPAENDTSIAGQIEKSISRNDFNARPIAIEVACQLLHEFTEL